MRLLDRTGPIEDRWIVAEDAAPLRSPALVPLARLDEALATELEIGVQIPSDADHKALAPHFARLGLISVHFPSFADGRGFSIARCVRLSGYAGRLRAQGPVISDQFTYLLQVGFDEVAIPDSVAARQPVEQWLKQRSHVPLGYQRGVGGRGSILDQRRAKR